MGVSMKGDVIPSADHVARYCKPKTVADGVIQATAFMLRPNDEGLSVNWLEYLECTDRAAEIRELQRVFARKMSVGVTAKFAVLNVGKMIETVERESLDNRKLTASHQPEANDNSHSEIFGLRHDDDTIAELMVELIEGPYSARP